MQAPSVTRRFDRLKVCLRGGGARDRDGGARDRGGGARDKWQPGFWASKRRQGSGASKRPQGNGRATLGLLAASCFFVAASANAQQATIAPTAVSASKWESEIAAFERADRESPPPRGAILFIGSSSIRLWKTLAQDFPDLQVINRGFGGSEIADSAQFAERIVFPYEPRLVVFYAGGNDINAGKSPAQVFLDFKGFVAKVQTHLPHTQIAYISIAGNPARWAQVEKVKAANTMIEDFAKKTPGLKFINVFPHMLGPDGQPRPEIFLADRLHMNEKGYKLWTEIIRPFLR